MLDSVQIYVKFCIMLGDYLTYRSWQTLAAFVVLLQIRWVQSSHKNQVAGAKQQGGLASYNLIYARIEAWTTVSLVLRRVVDEKNTRKYFTKNAENQKSASRPNWLAAQQAEPAQRKRQGHDDNVSGEREQLSADCPTNRCQRGTYRSKNTQTDKTTHRRPIHSLPAEP